MGKWVVDQRRQRKQGAASLTAERIARLDAIGMIWDKLSSWEYRYELCQRYLEDNQCEERRQKILKLDAHGPDAKIDRKTKKYKQANTGDRAGENRIGPA